MRIKVDTKGLDRLKDFCVEISDEYRSILEENVTNLAKMAYTRAVELAKSKAKSKQQDYINALDLEEKRTDNSLTFILKLAPEMTRWEDGFPGYDMKESLLAGPNATTGKNGVRYNTVPFEIQPYSKAAASPSTTSLRKSAQRAIEKYGLDKIIKSSKNKALSGKVGVIRDKRFNENIQGLTKFQKNYGKTTQSTYKTFRRVSDNSSPDSWQHPGFDGYHVFDEVENFVIEELDNIINSLGK